MAFLKKKEDFICKNCRVEVIGNGYTNHCPKCLFSLHVDIEPGDRKAICRGLMKPIRVEGTEKEYRLIHKCIACGYEKPNKLAPEDNMDAVVALIRANAARV